MRDRRTFGLLAVWAIRQWAPIVRTRYPWSWNEPESNLG